MDHPELADFTGRRPFALDLAGGRAAVEGRVVLVTGAGGSIGALLSRLLLHCRPARTILLDVSEHHLDRLALDLATDPVEAPFELVLGDGGDAELLRELFRRQRPDVVVHAAAHKHAPLLETQPLAAVRNNLLVTHRLLAAAREGGASRFLMISTDKAVAPRSIMGASKRLAELLLLAEDGKPRTTSLRLGNVWGSHGSVLPRFLEQLRSGVALTVTHPGATRYFLAPEEAVALALHALAAGRGRDILVPDLGRPIPILDVARRLLAAAGEAEPDTRIRFTGLRPGDKLEEAWIGAGERHEETGHPDVRRIVAPLPAAGEVRAWLRDLEELVARRDAPALVERVVSILPDYRPSSVLPGRPEADS